MILSRNGERNGEFGHGVALDAQDQLPAQVAIPLEENGATRGGPVLDFDPVSGSPVLPLPEADREASRSLDKTQPGALVRGHDDPGGFVEATVGLLDHEVSVEVSGGHSCSMRGFFAKIVAGCHLVRTESVSAPQVSQSRWGMLRGRGGWGGG